MDHREDRHGDCSGLTTFSGPSPASTRCHHPSSKDRSRKGSHQRSSSPARRSPRDWFQPSHSLMWASSSSWTDGHHTMKDTTQQSIASLGPLLYVIGTQILDAPCCFWFKETEILPRGFRGWNLVFLDDVLSLLSVRCHSQVYGYLFH